MKIIMTTLLVSIVTIFTISGCQKTPEVVGEKLVEYTFGEIGKIKVKVDAINYFDEINKQLPSAPNQPVITWVRRCAAKEYFILRDVNERPLPLMASTNIENCQNELKILRQILSNTRP